MTLDEAIKHCDEKAVELWEEINTQVFSNNAVDQDCVECAKAHEQLARWLRELKDRREKDVQM